ncbi:MAG: triose-phosphate isomerase [Thalassolituus oleivorans]|uniref:triose-phosphate isomerase n=1 Tax=Thalassolituus oleivorans TaxID=187493 RepID=UPI001B4B761E|nr:triose-phosphate isomerase [Thalassolituus oleivorans]MBQ0726707.1 triose-phosphate isomerase [Thalassolituus oleivorans]
MRRLLVAGNWKMNASVAMTEHLLSAIRDAEIDTCDVAVFPPFPYLALAHSTIADAPIRLGAQTCSLEQGGAFTGEVAVSMLSEFQVALVLVGHSERRSLYGETDKIVLLKTLRVLEQGMTAVVCIGETLEERQAGNEREVVETQLRLLLDELSDQQWQSVVLAYEPVWAIGTGETATPEQAQAMHRYIRSLLQQRSADIANTTQILYGGSVKAANAAELFSQPDIDGGLVGGASLDANEFLGICRAK